MNQPRGPDFLIIGAQKAGTTWLWAMLRQHPGIQLPETKEIHFFGGSEVYSKGLEWYLSHFARIPRDKITGEGSTAMFFDRAPFWLNAGPELAYDETLPPVPELVRQSLGFPKIIVILRDPVRRAVSAYRHWIRHGNVSPFPGLRKTALAHPKLRILEYGDYAQHLSAWMQVFPPHSILPLIYEEDVVTNPSETLAKVFEFLAVDTDVTISQPERRVHGSWTWTRNVVHYMSGPFAPLLVRSRLGAALDRSDFLKRLALKEADIRFLERRYRPQKETVARLTGRDLGSWDYGQGLLSG